MISHEDSPMTAQKTATVTTLPGSRPPATSVVREALAQAVKRVAPLWSLDHFVAVNPFLGFTEERFEHAARRVSLACDAQLLMPRKFYREALESGRMAQSDIERALSQSAHGDTISLDALLEGLQKERDAQASKALTTCADVAATISGKDWSALIVERVSHWASGYFDAGQASWPSPFRDLRPYEAWRREASIDCSDTVMGLASAQDTIADLPDTPEALCEYALQKLAVPEALLDLYLHRLLASIGGWVAYARYQSWGQELAGESPKWVVDLLAIRLAWELVLMREMATEGAEIAWRRAVQSHVSSADLLRDLNKDEAIDQVLQEAFEHAWQRKAINALAANSSSPDAASARPSAQAVFCIDVRSEVLRRAIEAAGENVETLGFAGFFGLPIEYQPLAGEGREAHCPVLLSPAIAVQESLRGESVEMTNRLSQRIRLRRHLGNGWRAFKNSAVSCFVFVESYGLAYAYKLAAHTLGLSRPEPHPSHRGLPPNLARNLGPQLAPVDGIGEGIGIESQIDFAHSMLKGMSLTEGFARVVMLAGHGSSTTNNAHATGLDCGACGGQTGEASARLAAMILNNPPVRDGLRERGISVPEDTVFVAALHNTTTDAVELFDLDALPDSHKGDISDLQDQLSEAGKQAREERSKLLAFAPGADPLAAMETKSRDWSEVRPEWGLAGCAGFIAAPRRITRNIDLEGQAFLHSYDYRQDPDFSTLELIMSAPMVVASWISLQYYGSTVDNQAFGSGNKTLHNVVGGSLGVLEGNGGDLRVGLPLQSVHDGEKFVHEPRRLSVFLAAPISAINRILDKHPQLQQLVDNGWLKLFAVYDDGKVVARYMGDLQWDAAEADAAPAGVEEA
ncbi:hypothetical protein KT71_13195 [Congregibacter litoralis KT71]|uniref:Probable inorganic carbon transporter subunit DabA n=2 Tax=Congregibacter TaxID=393661 RepID=A4ACB6_9GAMM|nr:hypothetical protein KT71_13195 [Congregibacter litoralis KT71]